MCPDPELDCVKKARGSGGGGEDHAISRMQAKTGEMWRKCKCDGSKPHRKEVAKTVTARKSVHQHKSSAPVVHQQEVEA